MLIMLLFLRAQKNIVRFSHENIRIFKEFTSIVNMLRALILLTRKCHNIIKHSFNENIKELDYFLISYWNWNVLHFPHSAFSTLRTFHTPHFPHSALSTLRTFHTYPAFSTPRIFHTPHSALFVFHRTGSICPKGKNIGSSYRGWNYRARVK